MMSERPQEVVGTPFDMDLETGKLLEFERATKSSALAQSADGERFIAPTFLMAAAFWRTPASDVLDYSQGFERTLHATEEFIFPGGPPKSGVTLTGQAHINSVETKTGRRGGNMTFTEVVTEFRDPAGNLVVINSSVTVEVENPPR